MATQDDIMALAHEEGKCVTSPEVAAASDEVYQLATLRRRCPHDCMRHARNA